MKPTLYVVLILITMLTCMWAAAAVRIADTVEDKPRTTITQESFDKVRVGMTVDEVETALGVPAHDVMKDTTPAGLNYSVRTWSGSDWEYVRITFVDGKVTDHISRYLK